MSLIKKLKRYVEQNKIKLKKLSDNCYTLSYVDDDKELRKFAWSLSDYWNRIEKGVEVILLVRERWLEEGDNRRLLENLIESHEEER